MKNFMKSIKSWSKKEKRKFFLIISIFLLSIFFIVYPFIFPYRPIPSSEDQRNSKSLEIKEQEPFHKRILGRIGERGSLFKSLAEKNIPLKWIDSIISELKPLVNFKKIRQGTYTFITDIKGEFIRFILELGPTEIYEVEKSGDGLIAKKKEVILDTHLVKIGGEIRSSLFEAIDAIGEHDQLVISFAEILASEIDFYKDVKEGDRFQVILEKLYKGKEFIRYGLIRALEYRSGEKIIRGIHFEGNYYNEKGISLRRPFLRAPLRFSRISSRFSRARRHPILGGIFPHFGVDYAAPKGTPVRSVSDGVIIYCGWAGGFGKQVIIKHPNGYKTYYGHLSRFGPGIKNGSRVKQKQIIGYVGSTGLSTGPHLDYRLMRDGRFINPLNERFPSGGPIERGKVEAFRRIKDEMVRWLDQEVSPIKKEGIES